MPLEIADVDQPIAWSTIVVDGPQAHEFLQGQVTQDIDALVRGPLESLLLAPDSVVVTSCRIAVVDGRFELVVPSDVGEAARLRLTRFKLRTQCTIDLVDGGEGPYASVGARIDAGRPAGPEFARGLTPHSFGRSFVDATISFTKGCFTGQELVGRLDARDANAPWRLVRVSGPDLATIDDVVRRIGPEGPRGVTTAVIRGERVVGLAIAHRRLAAEGAPTDDVEVVEVT
jgi:folate-binding protein YgfZ